MTTLVESCFCLDIKLLKNDLSKTRRKEPVEGYFNLVYQGKQSAIDYSVEYCDDKAYLVVSFTETPQRILLSEHELTFGTRTYLTCGCENRTNALYLKNGIFACRKCHKLTYESTTINTSSKHGKFFRQQHYLAKFLNSEDDTRRIFYRSKPTRRLNRRLDQLERAGLIDKKVKLQELITAVNNFQQ